MSLVENPDDDGFYMPHHAVIKESNNTTKNRIVFDALAKSNNGVSLNDILMIGPTIQNKLFSHLIRFRTYNYAISADIGKMYRQVLLHEDDRRYQRILWRENGNIKTFQLNTLTFGIASSPFLAIRTVQKLADDEGQKYPKAAEVLKNHLYVDDLLSRAETIEQARATRDEIIALLKQGGFNIRQWASNDLRVINDLSDKVLYMNLTLNIDRSLKTLGISWDTGDDKIYYSAHPINITGTLTKRKILSEIAKIFDPMGLMGPVVLYAKRLMQDVWRCGVHWDESVSQSIHTEWSEFIKQMKTMHRIQFDREVLMKDHCNVQIHGFCDASNIGYGACLYVRSIGKHKGISSKLLCSKSRVAPLKPVTIPRLELCGALLLARLYREASDALNITPNKIVLWSDSTIVLHWLKTPPHLFKTYVANRVAEIQELPGSIEWRHIRSEDNPADALSRGQLPQAFARNKIWREGPSWLTGNECDWYNENIQIVALPELKTNTCLIATPNGPEIFKRYSSYSKLCRIMAYCLRAFRPTHKYSGSLLVEEINEAETRILKIFQTIHFSDDITKFKNTHLPYKGKFIDLNPFLDENGLIRVGGRLQMANLTFSQKHPILLPSRHQITDQIIREIHETHFHAGIQTTLYTGCILKSSH